MQNQNLNLSFIQANSKLFGENQFIATIYVENNIMKKMKSGTIISTRSAFAINKYDPLFFIYPAYPYKKANKTYNLSQFFYLYSKGWKQAKLFPDFQSAEKYAKAHFEENLNRFPSHKKRIELIMNSSD